MKLAVALMVAGLLAAGPKQPLLRHTNYVAWEGTPGQTTALRLRCQAHGYSSYADELIARAIGPDGAEIDVDAVSPGQEGALRVTPRAAGTHLLQLRSGWNLAVLNLPDCPHAYVATDRVPLQTVREFGPLFFYVPEGTTKFTLRLSASVKGEGLLLRVLDPQGQVALEREGDFDDPEKVTVTVGPGQAGRAWSLALHPPKAAGLNLDDVMLSLLPPLAPYLSERAEWAERFGKKR